MVELFAAALNAVPESESDPVLAVASKELPTPAKVERTSRALHPNWPPSAALVRTPWEDSLPGAASRGTRQLTVFNHSGLHDAGCVALVFPGRPRSAHGHEIECGDYFLPGW